METTFEWTLLREYEFTQDITQTLMPDEECFAAFETPTI